jgi:phenylacetate-CoA ligase
LLRALYHFCGLKRNLSLSPLELQEQQRRRLTDIVRHAYENVPFYHRKFDAAGIKPDDIKSVKDLAKIPVTTKSEIQSSPMNDVLSRGVETSSCVHVRTSGSSGRRLEIYLDRNAADYRFAMMARTYWEDGLRPWNRLAIIHSTSAHRGLSSPNYRGVARRLHISKSESIEKQIKIIKDYRPDFLEAYPSCLVPLARACQAKKVSIRPRMILTGSELLLPEDVELIRSVFDCDSVDDYGCHEIGHMTWECREHAGYHMNVDGVVMEFLDEDGEQVAPGERGEIVCTSLVDHAMPFIRYHIDDIGVASDEKCPCGRPLPLMNIVEGRKDDFLTAVDGRTVSPMIFSHLWYLGHPQDVTQFRVIQESRDRLTIQLEGLKAPLDEKTMNDARSRIAEVLGEDMQVEFQLVDRLEADPSGKLRKIMSRVQVSPILEQVI